MSLSFYEGGMVVAPQFGIFRPFRNKEQEKERERVRVHKKIMVLEERKISKSAYGSLKTSETAQQ